MAKSAKKGFNRKQPESFETHVYETTTDKMGSGPSGTLYEKMRAVKVSDDQYQMLHVYNDYSDHDVLTGNVCFLRNGSLTVPGWFFRTYSGVVSWIVSRI